MDTKVEKGPGIFTRECRDCGRESGGTWVGPELFGLTTSREPSPEPAFTPLSITAYIRKQGQVTRLRAELGSLFDETLVEEHLTAGHGELCFEPRARDERLALTRALRKLGLHYAEI